jgi:phage recombination protein Bet
MAGMSEPAGQENTNVTTTTAEAVDEAAGQTEALSAEDQALQDALNRAEESALDGTRPTELIHVESSDGRGFLTIDPLQDEWTPAQLVTLKSIGIETEGRDAVPMPYVLQFLHVCQLRRLDPWLREAYLITHGKWRYDENDGKWYDNRKYTLVIGIDGYRTRGEAMGDYAGQVGPEWCGDDGIWRSFWSAKKWGPPVAARVGIMRKGFDVPVMGVAMYEEFVPMVDEYTGYGRQRKKTGNKVPTEMWQKMPGNQTAKCAEAQAWRKAYPRQFSGIYGEEEMDRAKTEYAEETREREAAARAEKRMAAYAASQVKPDPTGEVVDGEIVDEPSAQKGAPRGQARAGEPAHVGDVVREVRQQMSAQRARPAHNGAQVSARADATDGERLAWLRAELTWLSDLLGLSVEAMTRRAVGMREKPLGEFTADELQLAINPLRAGGVARLRANERGPEADAYAKVPPGVAAPLHVLLGLPDPMPPAARSGAQQSAPATQERAQVDPTKPHPYVDNGGVCRDCEKFADDTIHPEST